MIETYNPIVQAFLGTLFTWFVTALGAGIVFLVPRDASPSKERLILDISLGFAGGVMLAATYWSLLEPAVELSDGSVYPVLIGFILGGVFVYCTSILLPHDDDDASGVVIDDDKSSSPREEEEFSPTPSSISSNKTHNLRHRSNASSSSKKGNATSTNNNKATTTGSKKTREEKSSSFRRILLMVIAVTVHNFPEGLAVGVAFGSLGADITDSDTMHDRFNKARNLAIGIGLQNFPEGLAVSLPLYKLGMSPWKAFFLGQLSGMVEPLGGVLGAYLINIASPLLPYALAFAGGAMIYVVAHDLIPESTSHGNVEAASWSLMIGFSVMMSMDVML